MALNVLLVEEMVSVTGPMIDPEHHEHTALLAVPAAAQLLPAVKRAHDELVESQLPALTPERKAEISAELGLLDTRHDDLIRGVFHVLTGAVHLAATAEGRAKVQALRDLLLPDGLSATVQTYRVEAGQATLLSSRVSEETLAALAGFIVPETNLRAAVEEWIDVGGQIGALEDERTPGQIDESGDAKVARHQWVRTMRTLIMVLDLVAADDAAIAKILARVAAVERKATERSYSRRGDGDGAGDGDGTGDEPTPGCPEPATAEPADAPPPASGSSDEPAGDEPFATTSTTL